MVTERALTLTAREKQIIQLIKQVPSMKVMAKMLGISYRTLQAHLSKLYAKFRVTNHMELIFEILKTMPDELVI